MLWFSNGHRAMLALFGKKVLRLHVQIQRGLRRDLYRDASPYDKAHFVIPFP